MRAASSITLAPLALAVSLAFCLSCAGCGDSGSQPAVTQTEEQKAQQAVAEKATADAFKTAPKQAPKR